MAEATVGVIVGGVGKESMVATEDDGTVVVLAFVVENSDGKWQDGEEDEMVLIFGVEDWGTGL